VKEVGYVEHRLMPDGSHDSAFVRVTGAPTLDIADFPGAYGPVYALFRFLAPARGRG
jgi:Icc protein